VADVQGNISGKLPGKCNHFVDAVVVAADEGQVQRPSNNGVAEGLHTFAERSCVIGVDAVALHRGGDLDHNGVGYAQLLQDMQVMFGTNRKHCIVAQGSRNPGTKWREHEWSHRCWYLTKFVHGANGNIRGDTACMLDEHRSTKAVAIALHDGEYIT
jgi:hypothetical protein